MTKLILHTKINATVERCFLLSLSVDLHKESTAQTNEKVIAGVSTGLVKLNDVITWEAKHLGVVQKFTSKITALEKPGHFTDEMQKGAFKKFHHQHYFKKEGESTPSLKTHHSTISLLLLKHHMEYFVSIFCS